MIYSASLFEPENHHGILIPICRSLPRKLRQGVAEALVEDHPLRDIAKPSAPLLGKYKARKREWDKGIARYLEAGYEDPLSFMDHCRVCGSLQKALDTPEPWQTLGENPEKLYLREYRTQLRSKQQDLKCDLGALASDEHEYTLLCWEKAGEFCHRNLVMQCVMSWHPKSYGGLDAPRQQEA